MMASDPEALEEVHACLGCPLIVNGKTIGILTADSISPHAFDEIDDEYLGAISVLAGATLRTSLLLEKLEESISLSGMVAQDLMNQASAKGGGEFIGTGVGIQKLKENIKLVAKSELSVLVSGETGTGKELVARSIHSFSRRYDRPMIYVNCAAIPESIAESELFGHKKGAFTGAIQDRPGKFEVANHGTLFLDEIGELPLNFRADLYHRLNVYPLVTPPLRQHLHDIPLFVGYFCDYCQRRLGCKPFRLTEESLKKLKSYQWPGNVRELKNVISRATLHASQDMTRDKIHLIGPEHLFISGEQISKAVLAPEDESKLTLQEQMKEFKKKIIVKSVRKNKGNWSQAAKELGLHRSNLYHLRDQLKIEL